MGVPILTSQRYEADDVIGTLATKAVAAGLRGRDRHRRQGLLPARARRHQGLQPEGRGHLVRRRRREGEVRRRAGAGRRRARADGRLDRQHQGRAGHRREGRARADRDVRRLSRTCSRTPARSRTSGSAKGCSNHADDARQSRSWRASTPTCRSIRSPRRCATAARRASAASSSSRGSASARSSMEYAPTAETVGKNYRIVEHRRRACARWRRDLRAAGAFALRVLPDAPSAMRAGIVGLSFSTAPREADYVPIRASAGSADVGFDRGAATARSTILEAGARRPGDRAKSGHDLKFDAIVLARHGVDAAGARHRHDDRELPDGRDARRRIRWRISRSSTPATRR